MVEARARLNAEARRRIEHVLDERAGELLLSFDVGALGEATVAERQVLMVLDREALDVGAGEESMTRRHLARPGGVRPQTSEG